MQTRNKVYRIYNPESIGTAIRQYRQEAGFSQAVLAEKVGIHRTYLSELEGGHETEHMRRLLRILKELGVRMTFEKADW